MFGVVNRGELSGKTEHEFEQLSGRLKQFLLVEHDEDGTHTGLDASSISSGTLSLDRLPTLTKAKQHSQTAYKDEANVFTLPQFIDHPSVPALILRNNGTQKAQFAYNGIDTLLDVDGSLVVRQDFGASQMMHLSSTGAMTVSQNVINHATQPELRFLINNANHSLFYADVNGHYLAAPGNFFIFDQAASVQRFRVSQAGQLFERGRTTAMGEWLSYTPVLTGITIGNGTVTAKFSRVGKTVHYYMLIVMGSTTTFAPATQFGVSLPTAHGALAGSMSTGHWSGFDSSASLFYAGTSRVAASPNIVLEFPNIAVAGQVQAVAFSAPFTWAQNDQLYVFGTYEEP